MSGATIYVNPATGRPNSSDKASDREYENKYGVTLSEDYKISEGQKQGLDRGQALYGLNYNDTRTMVQDIIKRRNDNLNKPSIASDEIRRTGQQTQRRMRSAGASDAQQRQAQLDTSRMAGIQQYVDYERHLQNKQDMVSSIIGGLTGLEYNYAALEKSGEVIPPPKEESRSLWDFLGF